MVSGACSLKSLRPTPRRPRSRSSARSPGSNRCGGLVAWSRDGSKLITLYGGSVGDDGSMSKAQSWETATFTPIGKPLDHNAPIRRMEWDAHSARVLTIGSNRDSLKNKARDGYA